MKNFDYKNENGRSLFSENGADAPTVLSDVSGKRYMSEKITSRCSQYGRSMIEMLGVLAIIGVLSVGGIAGYSKSMQKYRINKTIEQITLIAGNVRTFFAPQRNYKGLHSGTDTGKAIIKKAKLVPDEMLELNADGTIKQINNAFGGTVNISGGTFGINTLGDSAFSIEITEINTEACIELASYDWRSSNTRIILVYDDTSGWQNYDYIDQSYFEDGVYFEDVVNTCSTKDNGTSLVFIFKDKKLSNDELQEIYDCVGNLNCWE